MSRKILLAGAVLASLAPAAAFAQSGGCRGRCRHGRGRRCGRRGLSRALWWVGWTGAIRRVASPISSSRSSASM